MSWFGKIVGGTIGLMFGGPLGAIAGAAAGHYFYDRGQQGDGGGGWAFGPGAGTGRFERQGHGFGGGYSAQERAQAGYFVAVFSIFGKIAKADGTITKQEGDLVMRFLDQMGVQGEQRQFAIDIFNNAKDSPYSAEDFARQFAELTRGRREIHLNLIDMLFQIALADGALDDAEETMIHSVARTIGIDEQQVASIQGKYGATADKAYKVLGVDPNASDDEVRAAYKKLVNDYHPDKITSKGLPEEFVQFATKRFQEIQDAYESVKKQRGMS